ncbi:MAG: class I SAM-dependent methyltransferase [Candidatus Aenigmatarchaeota archaeon]
MKIQKAEMFNLKAASDKSKPDEILKILDIKSGQALADIGSGGGYFAMRFAEAVGRNGIVYAVDVNKEFLDYVMEESGKKKIENIKPVLSDGETAGLPEKGIDLVFMRNAYHHIPKRVDYFRRVAGALKGNGRIAIVERIKGGFSLRSLLGHFVDKKKIMSEMNDAGYDLAKEYDILARQSFMVFKPKK